MGGPKAHTRLLLETQGKAVRDLSPQGMLLSGWRLHRPDGPAASIQPALLLQGQVGLVDLAPGNLEIPGHLVRQTPPP